MAKSYSTLTQKQIDQLVKSVSEEFIQQDKILGFEQFKIICKNYIDQVQKYIFDLQNRKNLIDRIFAIGSLMHEDISSVQSILVLSHAFEVALNTFLGRKIPVTWISNSGNIKIVEESKILSAYGSANLGLSAQHGKGITSYVGRIEGVNNKTFQKEILDPELKKLQQQLTRSSMNKKAVFQQAKRRYANSPNMSYAQNPKTSSYVQNIYWRTQIKRGTRLRFSGKISNYGYIGEGYVAMVLHTKNDELNTRIHYPSSQQAPPYDMAGEKYLEILSQYALQGDAIPGIIQGDVKATDDGNIQLAVKQGRNFSSASIAGNIAIAYAILYKSQNGGILNPKNIRQQLENIKTTNWQAIFTTLTGTLQQDIKKLNLNFLLNI